MKTISLNFTLARSARCFSKGASAFNKAFFPISSSRVLVCRTRYSRFYLPSTKLIANSGLYSFAAGELLNDDTEEYIVQIV